MKINKLNFLLLISLGFLQKANVAKSMIANNKYYPYQNLIRYNPNATDKINGGLRCSRKYCNAFNILNDKNYSSNMNKNPQNEYIKWLKQTKVLTPYLKYDPSKL